MFFYAIFIVFDTGQESKVLQKKWKNLRDTFRRKQQEMKAYVPSGSGAGKKPDDWKFYHLMEIFIPTLDFRKYVSQLFIIVYHELIAYESIVCVNNFNKFLLLCDAEHIAT